MKRALTVLLITAPASLQGQSPASAEGSGLRDGPHQVVINNVRLWYRVAGRAAPGVPPVVYLHGGPGQGSYPFAALIGPALEGSLRMVYLDQRALPLPRRTGPVHARRGDVSRRSTHPAGTMSPSPPLLPNKRLTLAATPRGAVPPPETCHFPWSTAGTGRRKRLKARMAR